MSSTVTEPPLTADQLTIIVTSVSCMVFFIVILMLLVALYRKDPFCCRDGLFRGSHCTDSPPQYHSRHSLVGCPYDEHSAAINQGTPGTQLPGMAFLIGKPNHYHLAGPPPRLPSYESVRKKDRQRRIHSMIAQRFGLDRSHTECEPPPSYEETLRHSVDISTVDLHSMDMDINPNIPVSHLNQETHANEQSTDQQGQQPPSV